MELKGLSKDEYEQWLVHPVTAAIVKELKATRKGIRVALGEGQYLNMDSVDNSALNEARAVGNVDGLDEFLNIEFAGEGEDE